MLSQVLESPEPSQLLRKQESNVLGTAPGMALHQVHTALMSGTSVQKGLPGLLPGCSVPGGGPEPSQELFKRSNQITPWLNLSHFFL